MSDLPAAQRHALEAWASQAIDAGWLASDATDALRAVITAAPGQLFDSDNRPLVAGLFGGTGVGKSTLMNRIAGETIARVSAERPTSRDITVYVHRSQAVDRLPSAFPMERMRTAMHNNERYRHVLFIDMPDFDSVESANRDLVDLWLPHLDVVLYVVSPDRYRDDQGWRLLLQHAHDHAWLFIMNHWDRGDPVQIEDFRQQLSAAGLTDPMIFRSDSSTGSVPGVPASDDDFDAMRTTLEQLADQSIVNSLHELGILARLQALKHTSDAWLEKLGSDERMSALQKQWQAHWDESTASLAGSLTQKAQQVAERHAIQEGSWLSRWRSQPAPQMDLPGDSLVDEALLTRLDNILADFLNQQSQDANLPLAALKQSVAEPYTRARRDFADLVDDALMRSLAMPGGVWQRRLYTGLGVLCLVLPLGAMGWIAWRVVNGFAEGGSNPAAYLGSNFAVNGALLLALSWAVPAFLQRKVKPSRQKAAYRGLATGLETALLQTAAAVSSGFDQLGEQSGNLRKQYRELWQSLSATESADIPEAVRRMLASEISKPVQRDLDVRANTHNSTDAAPVS